MREKEVSRRRHQYEIEKLLWVFQVTPKEERANLWNVELQIISERGAEVRVNSAQLFQILNGIGLVSI